MNTRATCILTAIVLFGLPCFSRAAEPANSDRLRVIIETDAGGDPDDEQSLVRFLLYVNEWDVEGIIANRAKARDGENLNRERTGLDIVRRMIKAYGECHARLAEHDKRYPTVDELLARTVSGYEDSDDGVKLILAAVDAKDPRPVWFCNWGTDHGAAPSSLKRALDRVLKERGQTGYAAFKNRIRLSSDDQFGEHTSKLAPPWPLWIDTLRPTLEGKRWYWRFAAITATAGGFDLERDVRSGHGPLGALYPTNTTHRQKEGDTMMFLYLVPTGMNDPNEPAWGSWAGRYGPREDFAGRPYHWANQRDTWQGTTHRENSLRRWAAHLQNDFKARMDWCVKPRSEANHAPIAALDNKPGKTIIRTTARAGETVQLFAAGTTDPDGNKLSYEWITYDEAGTYTKPVRIENSTQRDAELVVPADAHGKTIHVVLTVSDNGEPPLVAYRRIVISVK